MKGKNIINEFELSSANFTDHENEWTVALKIYRGFFLVFLMIFLVGINTYGWRSSGVNHVLIFELDPRDHLTHQNLLEVSENLSLPPSLFLPSSFPLSPSLSFSLSVSLSLVFSNKKKNSIFLYK